MLVEIIACSVEDAVIAEENGADRVELCVGIELGGLTPSLGLLREVRRQTTLGIAVMVRPRPGGFCYSESEYESMKEDVARFADEGASAIVTGVLKKDSNLDKDRMSELRDLAGGIPMVCHRCFDVTPNLSESLETLVKMRYRRVLSSGGHNTALEGKEVLRELIRKAAGRIEVLPGSGIRSHNVAELAAITHCNQVHATAFEPGMDPTTTNGSVDYGPFKKVSGRLVEEFVSAARA